MFKQLPVLLVLAALLLTACNSKGCYDDMSVKVYCVFYSDSTKKAVSVDSVTVKGVGSDSIIYDNETLSQLELDLNSNATETKYVIQTVSNSDVFTDTLTLQHTNKPWFQSMECGCMVFSTLTGCTTNGDIFKSVTIEDKNVTNIETEHVILYL